MEDEARMLRLRNLVRRWIWLFANPLWLWPRLQVDLGRWSPWGRIMNLKRQIDEMLFGEFARRRSGERAPGQDVLSLLIAARTEDGQAMTDEELRDQMITLLIAGNETSSTALAWAVHRILTHPPVLAAIRAELERVTGGGPIAPEHIPKLEYLDATVKENLRLNPIVPEVGRRLGRPPRVGGGDLPAGVAVAPSIYLLHHRPDLWPEPHRFRPERFLGLRPSPYEFLPFGGGARRCVGMAFAMYEMKVVLAQIFSRMELRPLPGYRVRLVRRSILFAPSRGVPVVVDKRAA
jgi:cytochrome P450